MKIWKEKFSRLNKNWQDLLDRLRAVICPQLQTLDPDQTFKVVKYTMNNSLHKVWALNKTNKCSNKISSPLSPLVFVTSTKLVQNNLYTEMEGLQQLLELVHMHDLAQTVRVLIVLT